MSPSSRGRGLKSISVAIEYHDVFVALFTRAWIEIEYFTIADRFYRVALFTRAWIEILYIK